MKINWKVRLKNPVFWLTVIPAIIALVYTVLGLFGVVPTVSEKTTVNAVTAIISALTTVGVLIDPTTKGICDSEKALTYEEPSGSAKEKTK
ncbi:MAG: phage holin [Acutalibacteraceae bacterium]